MGWFVVGCVYEAGNITAGDLPELPVLSQFRLLREVWLGSTDFKLDHNFRNHRTIMNSKH